MSVYQWEIVPIKNISRRTIKGPRIVIGAYGVGPSLIKRNKFVSTVWTVDHRETSGVIAFYTDLQVALNFAHRLQRDYGDISAFAKRMLKNALTDRDNSLKREINARRKHVTYVSEEAWKELRGKLTLFDQSQYPLNR